MRALMSVVTALVTLCAGSLSWAQEDDAVAILAVEISGDGPPELRRQLQTRIAESLASEGRTVIDLEQTLETLRETPELIGCSSSACLERISELTGAERFVRAIIVASGANYEVKLELLHASEEQTVLSSVADSCAVCTIAELNALTTAATARLLSPGEDQTQTVRIATEPPGAMITIDGRDAGRSPLDISLRPGEHQVVASMQGRGKSEKDIEVLPDGTDAQRFELLLVRPTDPVVPSSRRFGPWKWGAAGGSGAMLILGAVLIARDGEPTCDSTQRACRSLNSTMLGGVLSISGGVLMGAASAWMFWREGQDGVETTGTSLSVTADGAVASYSLRF